MSITPFFSVERIMRDVNHGWMIRYIHMNTASFFFIVVYIHIFRGLCFWLLQGPARIIVDFGCSDFLIDDGYSVHGLCAAVGPDELLGCYRNH